MFRHKHLAAAAVVAPLLSIIAWFSVDAMVSERPQSPVPGGQYPLREMSNCRYRSGVCALENGSVEIEMRAQAIDRQWLELSLVSSVALRGVKLSMADPALQAEPPRSMAVQGGSGERWAARLRQPASPESRIQLVVAAEDIVLYADVDTAFIRYQTGDQRDFRLPRDER